MRPDGSGREEVSLASHPVDAALPDLVSALGDHGNAVLVAETGAGKTTRVPPGLAAAGLLDGGQLWMLEPRRLAARAAARRMAAEEGSALGTRVGYQVRFDRRAGEDTRILVMTGGVLIRRLQRDPFLEGVSIVVFDELHERHLDTDLGLAMVRRVQRQVRPELSIIAMSATLDAEPVARFLGGCPVLTCPGRKFPVTVSYAPAGRLSATASPGNLGLSPREIVARVCRGVRRTLQELVDAEASGDILAFLPGVGEIRRCETNLRPFATEHRLDLVPLYGNLPAEQQDAALRLGPRRKVVLATNVAETSVTIEGVVAVVDGGAARELRFDPGSGLDRLELVAISRANADQRAGRAGRLAPGRCLRTWTEAEQTLRPAEPVPEIRRVDLAGPLLELAAWGEAEPATFPWLETPDPAALERAVELLATLGLSATKGRGRVVLTDLGRRAAEIPVHPRLAVLLLAGATLGHGTQAALLAALLSERSPFGRAGSDRSSRSDLLERLDALGAFEARGSTTFPHLGDLRAGAARSLLRVRDQLLRFLRSARAGAGAGEGAESGLGREEALARALLAAYPDRVARRRGPGEARAVMVGGRGVRLARQSAVRQAELFLCVDLDGGRRGERSEALVRLASALEPEWLMGSAGEPGELEEHLEVSYDADRDRVVGHRRRRYRDLVLAEDLCPVPAEAAAEQILQLARDDPTTALGLGPEGENQAARDFLVRLRNLAQWQPELALPELSEPDLRNLLPALAAGCRSRWELRRRPVLKSLQGCLRHQHLQALAREAPEHLDLASLGARPVKIGAGKPRPAPTVRLTYSPGQAPVLAARIQDLFGIRRTPTVAMGRIPVVLHLLAPNRRPQQVTNDLESFWKNTYPEVRKELKGRYPKHPWPVDPLG